MLHLAHEQDYDLGNNNLDDKRNFRDMNSFVKYRRLENTIGATRASTVLANSTFDDDFYDQSSAHQIRFCVDNRIDYFDQHLLLSPAAF